MARCAAQRVLVIDDDPFGRRLVCDLLSSMGYAAQGAVDGTQGLALLEQGGYDLVLADLAMPRMTGWEVAQTVSRRFPATRLVLTTGLATDDVRRRARERGLVLLCRPFQWDELRAVVVGTLKTIET